MITAIVFVKADVAQIPEVAQQIASLDGVSEVYSVTGRHRPDRDAAGAGPRGRRRPRADGSTRCRGCGRRRRTSRSGPTPRHDLEGAFSLGAEE